MEIPSTTTTTTTTAAATPAQLEQAFEHSIWYLLALWPALQVACASGWGGPDSADKRDWFAGAVADLFATRPDTDAEDLECFLLQIMQDEFDCYVEDETEVEVARGILGVRARLLEERTLVASEEVESRWRSRGQMKGSVVGAVKAQEVNQDVDGEEDEEDEDEGDVDMEAPALVAASTPTVREKVEPQVDEDGFTKVISKKKR